MEGFGGRKCESVRTVFFAVILSLIFIPFWAQKSESAEIYSIKDDLNRTVTVSHPAVKIVCLDEAHAENIVALRAVRQLTAVTDTASSKWVPKKIKRIAQNSSALQIAALEPDLVVMETDWAQGKKSLLDGLRKEGIPYAVFDEPHWGSFALYLERLGTLTGRDKEADLALISSEKAMDKSAVRADSVENKSLFVICGADFSTCAWDSWGARIAATAGAKLITDKDAPKKKDKRWIIDYGAAKFAQKAKNADYIITLVNKSKGGKAISRAEIIGSPQFKNIKAVKLGQVFEVDEADFTLPSLVRLDSSLVSCWQILNGVQPKKKIFPKI